MGVSDRRNPADIALWAEPDGSVSVDTGARYVPVAEGDLERILDRVASDGGSIHLYGGGGRADDGDDPAYREADPAMGAVGWVLALAAERGLEVIRGE